MGAERPAPITETATEARLADYRPPAFLVDTVDLIFDLGLTVTRVRASLAVRRNPARTDATPLHLDGEDLSLESVLLDGEPLRPDAYEFTAHGLTIPNVPDEFTLDTIVTINPSANTELSGLYVSQGDFFTQCEAEGFRRITLFPDRPDVMARFTATLIADAQRYPVLLSNGNPVDKGARDDGKHWIKWADPHPKPCYLFALVAGDLVAVRDEFTTMSGRRVALGIYVRRGDEDKCDHAMRAVIKSMRWDEEVFGLEYDLDIFNIAAVSDFNMGAMENKGLNIFNTSLVLAKPETATDADYESIERVIAHEYFHNWTGDRVTCRDWFQLSLKEGLTVFRDQEFGADQGSPSLKRISDVRRLRASQFKEDAGPLAHPVRPASYRKIDNFYTTTIYEKGAELVRMIRTIIGSRAFRRGMDIYIACNDNSAATIEDFIKAMQEASGFDLSRFMRWYDQAGTPAVSFETRYDQTAKRLTLTLRQKTPATPGQPSKLPVVVPVALGLIGPNGDELPARLAGEATAEPGARVMLLEDAEQSFIFEDVAAEPVPSLFRGFSAPVRLSGYRREQLAFLAAHDTDGFNRWDAGQEYALGVLLDAVRARQDGEGFTADLGLLAAMESTLSQSEADPGLAAETMALPSESIIGDHMETVDPSAIHAVREAMRAAIGRHMHDGFTSAYRRFDEAGPYSPDHASIGRRALKNTALAYLMAADPHDVAPLAETQFRAARNMTDVLTALALLTQTETPARDTALAAFFEKWRHDPLVLDKWFAVQATAATADALARIERLSRHPDFDIRNPNRVRALIAAFAYRNQPVFHEAQGGGYRFLERMVIEVDRVNRQIAARIISPLAEWKRFDPKRQAMMRGSLERILATDDLSDNTREMTSRALNG